MSDADVCFSCLDDVERQRSDSDGADGVSDWGNALLLPVRMLLVAYLALLQVTGRLEDELVDGEELQLVQHSREAVG